MARIDIELVNRNLISTRAKAQEAIKNGLIYCNDKCIKKNSYIVNDGDILTIKGELLKYVSRGGLKLEKAITAFNINLTDKVMCDIGSATGGLSDCAIQNNVKEVFAIDVGSNQFDSVLKTNPKIHLYENTDFRDISIDLLKNVNIVTIDVSFISVTKMIPKIALLLNCDEIVCLVKPQFECGKEIADKYKGIILDKDVHFKVINLLISEFCKIGFNVNGLTFSPIKGGNGNIEYLLYLKKITDKNSNIDDDFIRRTINNGFKNL